MLILNVLIGCGTLKIPLLYKGVGPLVFQVTTTVISVITTVASLYFESKGLQENFIEYIMTSVKAK